MNPRFCLYGGPLFDGSRYWEIGFVSVAGDRIEALGEGSPPHRKGRAVDVRGQLMAPGLVDLHSDALEKCIEMRPGVRFDPEFALLHLDQRVAACGITTFCSAIAFAADEWGMRSCQEAERLVRMIHRFTAAGRSRIRHRVHARYEITSPSGAELLSRLLQEGLVHMVSLMDHTPGQGQFRTLESYMAYKMGTYRVTADEVLRLVAYKTAAQEKGWQQVAALAQAVRGAGIPFLSHDDDSAEKVALVGRLGVTGSEFPLNLHTARAAKVAGMTVLMGAPNLIRDRSSNGHLRASEALEAAACDGLMSDYYPECLLEAPFAGVRRRAQGHLADMLRLVTSAPGDFLAPGEGIGRLSPGGPADIAVIDPGGPWARVTQTWVGGRCVFRSEAR